MFLLPYNDNNIINNETMLGEFQQTLYTYFQHDYGEHQNQSTYKYIRFFSKLLRFKHKNNGIIHDVFYQSDFEKDFWIYCKSNLDEEERPNLGFDKLANINYFKTKNKARNRNKLFCIPP